MTATFLPGIVIPLRPFFGSMGVAPPPAMGRVSSNPPGIHAGNLDPHCGRDPIDRKGAHC
jgi:acetamidase/formamidase